MRIPGFTADASLAPGETRTYRAAALGPLPMTSVTPQMPVDPFCVHCRAYCYNHYSHSMTNLKSCLLNCEC